MILFLFPSHMMSLAVFLSLPHNKAEIRDWLSDLENTLC